MKVVFGLIVIIAIVLVAVLFLGGYSGLSPEEQANALRNAAQPGTAWQAVADVKEPKKYQSIRADGDYGPVAKFDREKFEDSLNKGGFPNGFIFQYYFTADDAFEVVFDGQGKVEYIQKLPTFSDLVN